MAVDYSLRERTHELLGHIDHLHLTYLETDESPRKLDERKRLEGCIKEYLSLVQHGYKFCLQRTSEVLHRSVETKEDFSAYRATTAWTAIAAYAHNLLAQPWRREFHEIKTYSGFYKHNLESNLVGAELMLEAMGYKHTGRSTMVLDGPVDPDKVTLVSRDSLVALVECQIIRTIYAEVIKVLPTCTWLDVLQYRETHICTPEMAVRGMIYRLQQRKYEEQLLRNQVAHEGYTSRYHHSVDQCPYATRYHYSCTLPSPRYGVVSSQHPTYYMKPHELYRDSYYSSIQNGYVPVPLPTVMPPSHTCSVPTAQLIELDTPHEPMYTHRRSSSDHRLDPDIRRNGDTYSRSTISDDLSNRKSCKTRESNRDKNWGYVYQGLEEKEKNSSQRKEDYVERRRENRRPPSPLDLDDALKAFSLDSLHQISVPEQRQMAIDEALSKLRIEGDGGGKRKENRISVYDNSSPPKSVSPKQCINTLKEVKKSDDLKHLNMDSRKLKVKHNEKWECENCTYHNTHIREVCEMCGESRSKGGESKPLASGGRQCPICTLVNEKGVTTCDACGTSLKDSPTYI